MKIYNLKVVDINLRTDIRDGRITKQSLAREGRITRFLEKRLARIDSDYQECLEFVGAEN